MIKDILLVLAYETYVLQNVLHIAFWKVIEKRVFEWVGEAQIKDKFPGKLLTQWDAFRGAIGTEDQYYLLASSRTLGRIMGAVCHIVTM